MSRIWIALLLPLVAFQLASGGMLFHLHLDRTSGEESPMVALHDHDHDHSSNGHSHSHCGCDHHHAPAKPASSDDQPTDPQADSPNQCDHLYCIASVWDTTSDRVTVKAQAKPAPTLPPVALTQQFITLMVNGTTGYIPQPPPDWEEHCFPAPSPLWLATARIRL